MANYFRSGAIFNWFERGDTKNIKISPEDGYGHRNEKLFQKISRNQLSPETELHEGQIFSGPKENFERINIVVKSFDEDAVIFDLNHPLAGKNLNFNIEIVEIREATSEEIEHAYLN